MTSIPLILPLNAGEAAALGDLVYQQVEEKRLPGDLRNRFAARVPSLGLKTFTPLTGSLQQDPIHPSTSLPSAVADLLRVRPSRSVGRSGNDARS